MTKTIAVNDNDQAIIHNVNELKKVMLSLVDRFDDVDLKHRFRIPLIPLHKLLFEYIEIADKEGYLYRMKNFDEPT